MCHAVSPHALSAALVGLYFWQPAASAVVHCVDSSRGTTTSSNATLMRVWPRSTMLELLMSLCQLQGIELRGPLLSLHPGDTSDSREGDLLEIGLKLRLRAFPPLDMQF